jgi:Heavy-metal resistance
MKKRIMSMSLIGLVLISFPLLESVRAASAQEEFSETWDELGRALRDWAGRARDYFSFSIPVPREERPLISLMLRYRDKLGLSADQVRELEQLRSEFERESIRRDADLRIAEMDLTNLTGAPTVDLSKVETKVREVERLRADQRLARIRTIEKAKEQLTTDQRKQFQELLSESQFTRLQPGSLQ